MSISLIGALLSPAKKRKREEEFAALDEEDKIVEINQPSDSHIQLILYDTECDIESLVLDRLKQNSQFCNSVWNTQFPYSETISNRLKLNVEEFITKPQWWDKEQWKSIIGFLSCTAKELYRSSTTKLLYDLDKWIFVAQLTNYLEATQHLKFAADKLFLFAQQRRWIRGSVWDRLLPIFSKLGGETAIHSILSVMAQTEEAQFINRAYSAYDFILPKTLHHNLLKNDYDDCLLINPFDECIQMYLGTSSTGSNKKHNLNTIEQEDQQVIIRTLQQYKGSQPGTLTNESTFLERLDYFSYDFISKFGHELHPFCVAGGMISMLLESNIEHLMQEEMPASDIDIWLLSGRDASNAAKSFTKYLTSRKLVKNRDFKLKKSSQCVHNSLVTIEILIQPRRSFQFISIISSNAANVILNFDFSHLQWYCEPIYGSWRGTSGQPLDDTTTDSKLVQIEVRGTKAALLAFNNRCTVTQLPHIKPSRIGKALKRGYDVQISKGACIIREWGTTNVSDVEYAPSECPHFIAELDKKRQRLKQSNALWNKDEIIKLARSVLPVSLMLGDNNSEQVEPAAAAAAAIVNDGDIDDAGANSDSDNSNDSGSGDDSDDSDSNGSAADTDNNNDREEERAFLVSTSKETLPSHSNAQKDFDTLDGTRMSEYGNLLRLIKRNGTPAGPSSVCFAVDTTGTPCWDFRAFTRNDIRWVYHADSSVWTLASAFSVEFPPLLAEFSKATNVSGALMRLSLPRVTNWTNVAIYRALVRFLQELQMAAALAKGVTSGESNATIKNCKFDCDSTTGIPHLAFIVPLSCSIVSNQLHLGNLNSTETIQQVKDYYGTSGRWFRMVIKFKSIRRQYWQYHIASLTQVDIESSDWDLL